MKNRLRLPLSPSPAQAERLAALQSLFAQACNALAPVAQQHRCWNRVALHHLAYRQMRERFPALGSQMVCNAIYSVSRTSRLVFQDPRSPFHLSRWGQRPLPLLRFLEGSPVYFDRHTLSLKEGRVSMFTLDGRMHFQLDLSARDEQRFREGRLREIVLSRTRSGFVLDFCFAQEGRPAVDAAAPMSEWPEYVLVDESPEPSRPVGSMTLIAPSPAPSSLLSPEMRCP